MLAMGAGLAASSSRQRIRIEVITLAATMVTLVAGVFVFVVLFFGHRNGVNAFGQLGDRRLAGARLDKALQETFEMQTVDQHDLEEHAPVLGLVDVVALVDGRAAGEQGVGLCRAAVVCQYSEQGIDRNQRSAHEVARCRKAGRGCCIADDVETQ